MCVQWVREMIVCFDKYRDSLYYKRHKETLITWYIIDYKNILIQDMGVYVTKVFSVKWTETENRFI